MSKVDRTTLPKGKAKLMKHLKDNYINPSHPIAFSGIQNVYNFYHGLLTVKEVKRALSEIDSYTLHREVKNLRRNPYFVHNEKKQYQLDLIDMRHLAGENDGYQYLLVCIDAFTRFVQVHALKTKSSKETLNAIKTMIDPSNPPESILCDKGTEFANREFKAFCNGSNIKLFHNETSLHAAHVERFNRTIQNIIYKYLETNRSQRYVHNLQELVRSYNTRKHRMIGMSPQEAEKDENHVKVRFQLSKYYSKFQKRKPQLAVGTLVRVALSKNKFSRGYNMQYKDEIFRIKDVSTRFPLPLYILEDYNGTETIRGKFYEFELTPVTKEFFNIEKILSSKKVGNKKKFLVKWEGYDTPSWVDSRDIKDLK